MTARVVLAVLILPACLPLLTGCASRKPFRTVDARGMTPAELIRTLGPPARITSGQRVFSFAGAWVPGAQEYRYYVVRRDNTVAYWSFYYKDERWLSEGGAPDVDGLRRLDPSVEQDRKLIEAFEAAHPSLR